MATFPKHPLAAFAVWLREARRVVARRRLGGRGGVHDQPVATGGDGYQTEPPAVRD